MTQKAQQLPRVFVIGTLRLPDPRPGQPLAAAVRTLSRNYPQCRAMRIYEEDGVPEGNELVYTIPTPPAKVNG